jgi:hypothetical protein
VFVARERRDHFSLARPRRVLLELLERAVARGETPRERDLGLVPGTLIGLNLLRIVLGETIDRECVRRALTT